MSLLACSRRIAALASHGQTNREIAQHLYVAPKTVENHLAAVYRKTPFLANTPPERIDQLAAQPLAAHCAAPAPTR